MKLDRSQKFNIILIILSVGVAMFLFVFTSARNAELQYQINVYKNEITEYEREIQNLEVKIKNANNINNLEERAVALGLQYPDFNYIIYITPEKTENEELALALKESIYNHQ